MGFEPTRGLRPWRCILRLASGSPICCARARASFVTAIEVFVGHAFERPMVLSELSRNLEMRRDAVRCRLQRLIEIGLVECIDYRYYMTAKANAPLQREGLLAQLRNMQAAMKEVSKMDQAGL